MQPGVPTLEEIAHAMLDDGVVPNTDLKPDRVARFYWESFRNTVPKEVTLDQPIILGDGALVRLGDVPPEAFDSAMQDLIDGYHWD